MGADTFDFDAGELCLDFANTVEWHASEEPEDKLDGYDDLIRWGQAAGILGTDQARHLTLAMRADPDAAAAAYRRAIRLREAIYRIFVRVGQEEAVAVSDLALLNDHLQQALAHLLIVPSATGFSWQWREHPDAFDQIVWPVTRSAANLLTGDTLDRVGQCADDRGCGYLFLDTSRNRSRRWCSMESCGNRAKVHRHYRRQQQEQAQ